MVLDEYSAAEIRARQMREYEHPKEDTLKLVTIRALKECDWKCKEETTETDSATTIKKILVVTIGNSVLSVELSVSFCGNNGSHCSMTIAMGDHSAQILIPFSGESDIVGAFNNAMHDAKKRANERMIEEIVSFLSKQ